MNILLRAKPAANRQFRKQHAPQPTGIEPVASRAATLSGDQVQAYARAWRTAPTARDSIMLFLPSCETQRHGKTKSPDGVRAAFTSGVAPVSLHVVDHYGEDNSLTLAARLFLRRLYHERAVPVPRWLERQIERVADA